MRSPHLIEVAGPHGSLMSIRPLVLRLMKTNIVSADELRSLVASRPELKLVDVRLKEDYDDIHLPNAVSNCVFEVGFKDRMHNVVDDKGIPVCVYGAMGSYESRMAAKKLERDGYAYIYDLRGGLQEWQNSGQPVEGLLNNGSNIVPAFDGSYPLDLMESRVEWLGRNLINKHWGHVGIESGHLTFTNGVLSGGEVVLDMNAITCTDLNGSELHDVLVRHLKSDDFFDVERFPQAKFVIQSAAEMDGFAPGGRNLLVKGELTLKGVTNPVEFTSSAGPTPDGKAAAQALVVVDRTKWNVLYGSGRYFNRLAGHLVNDDIEFQLRVITA